VLESKDVQLQVIYDGAGNAPSELAWVDQAQQRSKHFEGAEGLKPEAVRVLGHRRLKELSMKKNNITRRVFAILLVAALPFAAAPARTAHESPGPETSIWVTAGPYVRWVNPPVNPPTWWAKRSDAWQMFTPAGERKWPRVSSHVSVLMTAGYGIQASCLENRTRYAPRNCTDLGISNEQSLDQYFRYIKARHLGFAFEIGLLTDTQVAGTAIVAGCGKEAFGRETSLRALFQKIKDAGGTIDYIRMDEPFFYGTRSCHDTVPNIAADLERTINNIVKPYFPKVRIGDVEPVGAGTDEPLVVGRWIDAFNAATDTPLAFFHADAAWNGGPVIENFAPIEQAVHQRSIPFGVIYNAGDEITDAGWTEHAIGHFVEAESALHLHVDHAVFQSWTANPTDMLPEEKTGTLMNVAFQYLLPATILSLSRSDDPSAGIDLTDSQGKPVAAAQITAVAVDVSNRWGALTRRVLSGKAPVNTAYAVVGIRANTEGVKATSNGEADLGAIILHYRDASQTPRTWKSAYATPYRIALSPNSDLVKNLAAPSSTCGNPAVSLAPDSTYTLEVPMSATGSADHAGYVALIFFNSQCHPTGRAFLYFTPSSRNLDATLTDSAGHSRLSLPANVRASGSELRIYYSGDNAIHRPAMIMVRSH